MKNSLVSRPHLDHLRRQAKSLLARLAAGDADALRTFMDHLPAAAGMSPDQIRAAGFRLADAQSAVARQTGFASWPQLARHVEQLRLLEGSWSFASLEIEGERISAAHTQHARLLIDGDRFRMESPGANYEGVFNIDVEHEPHHIDIEFVEGPEAGKWNFGVFRLEGDRLHICLDMRGKERPQAFTIAAGSGHAYEVLHRETRSRPENVQGGTRSEAPSLPDAGADPAGSDDFAFVDCEALARLGGEWSAVEIVRDGLSLPGAILKTARRSAKRNEITISVGGQVIIHALVRVNDRETPAQIDYFNLAGPARGRVQLGIMEWRNDAVCFCMGAADQARPTTFESKPGSGLTLSVWRKK